MYNLIIVTLEREVNKVRKCWILTFILLNVLFVACTPKINDDPDPNNEEPVTDITPKESEDNESFYTNYTLVDQKIYTYTQEGGTTNFYLGKNETESQKLVVLYKPAITIDIWELEKTILDDLLGYRSTYQVRSLNDQNYAGDTRKDFMTIHWQIPASIEIGAIYELTVGGVSRVTSYNAKSSEVYSDSFSAPGINFTIYAQNKNTSPIIVEDHTSLNEGITFGTLDDYTPTNDEYLLDRFQDGWYIPEPNENGEGNEGIAGIIIPESLSSYERIILIMMVSPNGPGYLPEFYHYYIYEAND